MNRRSRPPWELARASATVHAQPLDVVPSPAVPPPEPGSPPEPVAEAPPEPVPRIPPLPGVPPEPAVIPPVPLPPSPLNASGPNQTAGPSPAATAAGGSADTSRRRRAACASRASTAPSPCRRTRRSACSRRGSSAPPPDAPLPRSAPPASARTAGPPPVSLSNAAPSNGTTMTLLPWLVPAESGCSCSRRHREGHVGDEPVLDEDIRPLHLVPVVDGAIRVAEDLLRVSRIVGQALVGPIVDAVGRRQVIPDAIVWIVVKDVVFPPLNQITGSSARL